MTQKENLIKGKNKSLNIISFYSVMTAVLLPLFGIYLILDPFFDLPVNYYHKLIIIYCSIMLAVLIIGAKLEYFRKYFHIAHTIFVSGIMLINLFWFYDAQDLIGTASLIVSANLIGVVLIHPKTTAWFYGISISLFIGLAIYFDNYNLEVSFMFLIIGLVITMFNYWRNTLKTDLKNARETYQGMFDSPNQHIYVLSENLNFLDLNIGAEKYFTEHGEEEIKGKKFTEVFYMQSNQCRENMNEGITECRKSGYSKFYANCGIKHSSEVLPMEYTITLGEYFGEKVYLFNARIIKEQKDYEQALIKNKDNITKVLENISSFVFNITFDKKERFRHKVNFVSSRVENVYGYSEDEYISLVKSGRIYKDIHKDDIKKVNENFEELINIFGKHTSVFRMKVFGKWRWIEEKISVEQTDNHDFISLFGIVKDITNAVKKEEKLRDSEKKYKGLFESNLAGVYKTHIDGKILECNPSFAQILGYDSPTEILHKNIKDVYYDGSERIGYLNNLKKNKALSNHLSIIKRKDGRRLILSNNVSLIKDDADELNWIVGTVIDVTDLHETGLALTHSEEKYRLLFEESNNAILLFVLDEKESFVIDVNEQGKEMFGLTESNFIGKQLHELSANQYANIDQANETFGLLKDKERIESEWEFSRTNGEKFYAEVSITSVMLEEERVAQLVIKDISERKQYEAEILASRLSFKNIVERSPLSIMIFIDDSLTYLNPKGQELYKEVLKSKSKKMFSIFPESFHFLLKDLIKESENNIPSYTEISLGEEQKRFSISAVKSIYNKEKANVFLLQDISLQNEYNTQKLRAELAEETAIQLQEEVERHKVTQRSLSESSSRLQALLDSAANLFFLTIDKNYNLVGFNKNVKEFIKLKLGKELIRGEKFLSFFPVEKYAEKVFYSRFDRVLNGENFEMISHFEIESGTAWMEAFMNPIKIEGQEVTEISFIAHDITERIENRERITKSEENNKAILLALPDILFKVNKAGKFTDFRSSSESNKNAFSNFIQTDKVKGSFVHEVFKDKEVADSVLENVNKALKTDDLLTHNFSLTLKHDDVLTTAHYENRYSKLNENEVVIISRNVTETIEYESQLIETVKEKEVLLKEVHHRVKNNLQVINSILNLQSSYVTDDATLQIIVESQNRIRSMSYIHESLYQNKDFSHINFDNYLTNLVQNLVHSYELHSNKTTLNMDVQSINLALDQAIPCGLILNELITNALKYAYPVQEGGEIAISVKEKDNKVIMCIRDYGIGLPKGFNINNSETLGLSLVETLIDQIDGELTLKTESGTEFLIIFEKQEF
ncbi:MAG: PAS domain S-box-containing protein [Arenicella sp.]|jgi:PAS domain S-box-containing protein